MKLRLEISKETAFVLENEQMVQAYRNSATQNSINWTIKELELLKVKCEKIIKYLESN